MQSPRYLYLLSAQSYGHQGYFKVGISSNYSIRIRQVNQYLPFPVQAVVVVEHKNPHKLEQMFLSEFYQSRIKGEWFCVSPSENINCSECSYRDFKFDLSRQSKALLEKMKAFILENSEGRLVCG
tara:strand:+ start:204 stop:578 length:375 start_codon:yes stop_codon:yes gene_type:complete